MNFNRAHHAAWENRQLDAYLDGDEDTDDLLLWWTPIGLRGGKEVLKKKMFGGRYLIKTVDEALKYERGQQ